VRWRVFFQEAYSSWVAGFHPSIDEEQAMVSWLAGLDDTGPPPPVSQREIGTIPLQEANGPNGERVTFTYSSNRRAIGIVDIRPWPEQ